MGKFGDSLGVDGFVSISNPFNMARLAFWQKHNFIGDIVQKALAIEFKRLMNFHQKNPLLRDCFDPPNSKSKSIQDCDSLWEIDHQITR